MAPACLVPFEGLVAAVEAPADGAHQRLRRQGGDGGVRQWLLPVELLRRRQRRLLSSRSAGGSNEFRGRRKIWL